MAIKPEEWARTQALKAAMNKQRTELTDAEASTNPAFYPKLFGDGRLIKAGTRINWDGQLKRAAVDLWDNEQSTPDAAPTLWEDINYREGYRIIPEVITTGMAFAKDECGWWGDQLYKSLLDANTWTPAAYAQAWELVPSVS